MKIDELQPMICATEWTVDYIEHTVILYAELRNLHCVELKYNAVNREVTEMAFYKHKWPEDYKFLPCENFDELLFLLNEFC